MGYLQNVSKKISLSLFAFILAISLVLPAGKVFAADESIGAVSNKTGRPGQTVEITDLQVGGTGDDEITVGLYADGGRMWFDDSGEVSFENSSSGTDIKMSGTRSEINYVLSTLMFESGDEGTYGIEVTLGDGNYYSENGHVYQVIPAPGISWSDAREDAEELEYGGVNGYLATITDSEEHGFIRERINDSGWIGANDVSSEGVWRWQTGPEVGQQFWAGDENGAVHNSAYENWADSEPNDGGEGEDCGQIWFEDGSDGLWNDLDCNSVENQYYVVEFGGNTPESLPEIESTNFNVTLTRELTQVDSCDELFALGEEYASNKIELTADIDCGGRTEGPLFDEEDFTGVFEGNGFTIKNLTIANEDSSHVGLTGYSNGAEYHNLFLDNISLEGGFHNGVLAGHVEESIIAENIHATNINMRSSSDESEIEEMGVLFGTMGLEREYGESSIEHVSVQGTFNISNVEYVGGVGGLIGSMEVDHDFVIKQAYADVDIVLENVLETSENIGGLVGFIDSSAREDEDDAKIELGISDSYSWGSITAADAEYVGGLVGKIGHESSEGIDMSFTISNSYSWMDITASISAGGLVGYADDINNYGGDTYTYGFSNSFYAGAIDGDDATGIIVGDYHDFEEEYSTLEFDNVWYDADKVDGYDCVGNMPVDECNGANADGTQPTYFNNNSTNAPMDEWNFDTIWRQNAGTPPVFKPFVGNDSDQDGVSTYIESRSPNSGDANNDGIQDSLQTNVSSFVSPVSGQYVSVVVDDECELIDVDATAESAKDVQDSGYTYPVGLTNFTADCGTPGFTTTAQLYFYDANSNLTVRKFNPNTGTYFTINTATRSAQNIGGKSVTVVSYSITDGGLLDVDGEVDGIIIDPVGLANMIGVPNTGFGGKAN